MNNYPPGSGGPPPPYYGGPPPPPWGTHHHHQNPPHHHHHDKPPHHQHHHPPPHFPPPTFYPHDGGAVTAPQPSYPVTYFVPGTMMVPVPVPTTTVETPSTQPTYITNYIYHGESVTTPTDEVAVVDSSGDFDWVPSTSTLASHLTGRAVVGGHEGWDGSPLWVIRAWHNGDLIPGKLSVRHSAASVVYDGKEIPVQNIEVLCTRPENLRWVPASNGNVPPGAIPAGKTVTGEPLYVGRARYQLSVTPGKVHPSHKSCYIGFSGMEVAHKVYDVLCRVS